MRRIILLAIFSSLSISSLFAYSVETARRNGAQAREALVRSRRVLHAWLERRDTVTGLLPRTGKQPAWFVRDSAADLYPFLVMAAWFTDRPLYHDTMHEILRNEIRYSTRVGMLSDNVLPGGAGFADRKLDLDRVIFGSCEYAKDGLLPLTELLGRGAWYERMLGIADDMIAHAPYVSPKAGRIPSLEAEVNGEFLQVLSRLAYCTGESRYIEQALRIGPLERDAVEKAETARVAAELMKRLPRSDAEMGELIESGWKLASRMSWQQVVDRFVLPALKRAVESPVELAAQ